VNCPRGRLDYSASPNLIWSNLVQYDSVSRILGWWFRRSDGDSIPSFDTGSAKLQYTIRL